MSRCCESHSAFLGISGRQTLHSDNRSSGTTKSDDFQTSQQRLTRWVMYLQDIQFDVQYKPGKLHGNADGLSRQCCNPNASGTVLAAGSKQLEEGDVESPPLTATQSPA